ncbi:MAG: hypothetical protein R3A78_14855 [Polyangiales bacterium]
MVILRHIVAVLVVTLAMAGGARAQSSAAEPAPKDGEAGTPQEPDLSFKLNGYYRVRGVTMGNVPVLNGMGQADAKGATFFFQRLRLEPSLTYGFGGKDYEAKLTAQIDALDNVVWGDNARLAGVPIFAGSPSNTNVLGADVASIELKRIWLELMTPVGLLGVGRMPLAFGLKILNHDGNGLSDWGDPIYTDSADWVFFATEPLTIANAIATGDTRSTPLYFLIGYAQLAEDTLVDPKADVGSDAIDPTTRDDVPFRFLADGGDDVSSVVVAVGWTDKKINPRKPADMLDIGMYGSHRWQSSTESYVYVAELAGKLRHTPWAGLPAIYAEGDIYTIQGESRGVPFAGGCNTERCDNMDANIWGGAFRLGAIEGNLEWTKWMSYLELGFSSGDGKLLSDPHLTARPNHPDYRVGLLMYQVAVNAASAQLGTDLRGLWSLGGVYNSRYIYPQVRYSLWRGFELHLAWLAAWADELNPSIYINERGNRNNTSCGIAEGDCFLGWEVDGAVRVKWGKDDLFRWDTEVGLMRAGSALYTQGVAFGLGKPWLWTLQTRLAMIW